ncbi:ATP-binding protein [Sphingomonas ginkgonis]|uniref:ATP-binding protein n=2 Tax=Sphingomonas ginkgonis TaxID=2315330 RepID=A0A3R9YP98_9SPHN|nr:ATP-binding protein [Sphingomonas ginkgonis]
MALLDPARLAKLIAMLPKEVLEGLLADWSWQAHRGQREPKGDWSRWLILAGRGFGKTRAGAEWVHARARLHPEARIALVGGSACEAAQVMVEGESGLLATARPAEPTRWFPNRGELIFASGARANVFSGERPERLRGPQFHFAWCDELAKWKQHRASYDNLRLGLRLGERPQLVITTTPRPIRLIRSILDEPGTMLSQGKTAQNRNLSKAFTAEVERLYGGTSLGRQELEGVYSEEAEGALWSRALIEASRRAPPPREALRRVVVGVDPPAGVEGDACGILVCGLDREGTGWVLEDASVAGLSPNGWGRRVCEAASRWQADRVIAEANQGGAMVMTVLRLDDPALPVKLRHATEAKGKRAEPISHLFERGQVRLAGRFDALEDELVGMLPGQAYCGPGRSPDHADAMVWALAELMLRSGEGPVVGRV